MGIASKLRHRVIIEKPQAPSRDENGHVIEGSSWLQHKQLWARITHLSTRDMMTAQAQNSQIVARMMVRKSTELTTDMRVRYKDQVYSIHGYGMDDPYTGNEYTTYNLKRGSEQYRD